MIVMSNNKYRVKVCICQEFSTPFTSDLFFFKCSSSESKASVNFSKKNNLLSVVVVVVNLSHFIIKQNLTQSILREMAFKFVKMNGEIKGPDPFKKGDTC